jgi:hypothetical protein
MSVSTTVVSTRSLAPSSEHDRGLNDEIIDGFERLRRQSIEAAVEGVMLGHRIAVEIGELAPRQSVGDPFAQLAIIPVLDAHQNERAQHLRRRQTATALARLLQAADQIAPHPLDHLVLGVEEIRNRLQQRLQAHALPHQFDISKAHLPRRRSRHGSALALACTGTRALQRFDVARPGLDQQILQRTPIVHGAAHFAGQFFRHVNREPASVVPTIQNVTLMLLAGQTRRAVRVYARTASKAQ